MSVIARSFVRNHTRRAPTRNSSANSLMRFAHFQGNCVRRQKQCFGRPRHPQPWLMRRCWLSSEKKPSTTPRSADEAGKVSSAKPQLTKEQVEYISARAKNEQKFWDMMVPEKNLSFVGIGILAVVVTCLHFYNGQKDDEREDQEREEARLERVTAARRRLQKVSPEQRQEQIAFKERQEAHFMEKREAARAVGDVRAEAIANDRLVDIQTRLAQLRGGTGMA